MVTGAKIFHFFKVAVATCLNKERPHRGLLLSCFAFLSFEIEKLLSNSFSVNSMMLTHLHRGLH